MKNSYIRFRCTEETKKDILELTSEAGLESMSAYIIMLITLEANKKKTPAT